MEPTSLDSILDERTPAAKHPDRAPDEAPAKADAPASAEKAEKAEKSEYLSHKQRAQEKEFNAQGLDRDPATGQWKKRADTPATPDAVATAKAEAAPAAPAPAPAPAPAAAPAAPDTTTAQPELTARERAFYQREQDERRKRQEIERRLQELESKTPKEPPKGFWDDPEAAINNLRQEITQATATTKLQTAEAIARTKYPDFDEKVAAFAELVQQTPGLMQQCVQDANPAEFAYRLAKNSLELKQVGSMEEFRAKIEREAEARGRAAAEAEFKARTEQLEAARAALPGSLSSARSTGVNRPVWSGPTSFESILGKA